MTLRQRFEAYYLRQHAGAEKRKEVWFERETIWGADGYLQPCVHFEWLAFRAGYMAGRRK